MIVIMIEENLTYSFFIHSRCTTQKSLIRIVRKIEEGRSVEVSIVFIDKENKNDEDCSDGDDDNDDDDDDDDD